MADKGDAKDSQYERGLKLRTEMFGAEDAE